jgi:RNA methyltransferase, TrmH family
MPLSRSEISQIRQLRDKSEREASRTYVVEGPKVVNELVTAGHPFIRIYATPGWISPPGVDPALVQPVSAAEMSRLSHYPTPSPVLAIGRISEPEWDPQETHQGLTLALDGVQDPGNVGTLLRLADWFGFARVLLSRDCADLYSQKVINASMGSFARVRAVRVAVPEALDGLTVPVLGCDLTGESVFDLAPFDAGVVVIGSEGRGLSPAVDQHITRRITIPRFGGAESLNAAVAAGIVCAQLRRTGRPA